MPKVNVPEIKDLQAWIEEQAALPKSESAWEQSVWYIKGEAIGRSCGTAFCAAGRTVERHKMLPPMPTSSMVVVDDPADWPDAIVYHVGENQQDVWAVGIDRAAAQILGLDDDEADRLFRGTNTLDDMREAFREILQRAAEEGETV